MAYWLAWEDSRSGNLVHVENSCAGTWDGLTRADLCGRLGGNSRTPSMYADEKSDEAIVPRKRPKKEATCGGGRGGKGPHPREQPTAPRPQIGLVTLESGNVIVGHAASKTVLRRTFAEGDRGYSARPGSVAGGGGESPRPQKYGHQHLMRASGLWTAYNS